MSLNQWAQTFARTVANERFPIPAINGPQEATVVSATASECIVTLNLAGWEQAKLTCYYQPWPGATPAHPPKGTQCLVAAAGNGNNLSRCYVVCFIGWPTT